MTEPQSHHRHLSVITITTCDRLLIIEIICLVAEGAEKNAEGSLGLHKVVRNRRSIAYYKQLPEFWAWYKYYVDTHNQEGVSTRHHYY